MLLGRRKLVGDFVVGENEGFTLWIPISYLLYFLSQLHIHLLYVVVESLVGYLNEYNYY